MSDNKLKRIRKKYSFDLKYCLQFFDHNLLKQLLFTNLVRFCALTLICDILFSV